MHHPVFLPCCQGLAGKEPGEEKDTVDKDAENALDSEVFTQPKPPHPPAEGGGM